MLSTDAFQTITSVRGYSGGGVFLNDGVGHRLVLLDSSLHTRAVVLDSTAGTARSYGSHPGALFRFPGDSSLFLDPGALARLVIDPEGRVSRIQAVTTPAFVANFLDTSPRSFYDYPSVDDRGRVVFRHRNRTSMSASARQSGPDTSFVIRLDLIGRSLDTVGVLHVPRALTTVTGADGTRSMRSLLDPVPVTDRWAVLPDGAVALVRATDYRVDWVSPDGRHLSTGRMAFRWQRLDDTEKTRQTGLFSSPPLTGLAQIVGLAIGSPEFQRR